MFEKDQSKRRIFYFQGSDGMFKAKKNVTMPTSTRKWVDNDLQEYKECKEALPANINSTSL